MLELTPTLFAASTVQAIGIVIAVLAVLVVVLIIVWLQDKR